MAYQARLSDYVRGGVVVDATLQEGVPVVLTTSGARNELPGITAAGTNQVNQIGILFKNPDDFPRPTDARMYTASNLAQIDPQSGFGDPVYTTTQYQVGKSVLQLLLFPTVKTSLCLAMMVLVLLTRLWLITVLLLLFTLLTLV